MHMGKNLVNCKQASGGQKAKISNNLILAAQMVSVAEGNILGERLGIDLNTLNQVFEVFIWKLLIPGFNRQVDINWDFESCAWVRPIESGFE